MTVQFLLYEGHEAMRTRRDGILLAEKFKRVEDEAYAAAIKQGNKEGLVLVLVTVGAAALGLGLAWLLS